MRRDVEWMGWDVEWMGKDGDRWGEMGRGVLRDGETLWRGG